MAATTLEPEKYQSVSKRVVRQAHEIRQLANDTNAELVVQDERLSRVGQSVAQINDDINVSNKLLRGIKSIWGAFTNKFRRDNSSDHIKAHQQAEDELEREMESDPSTLRLAQWEAEKIQRRKEKAANGTIASFEKTGIAEYDERLEEIDKDLDELEDIVADIKSAALVMNNTLVKSNKRLDRTIAEADTAHIRIKKAERQVSALL